MKKVMAKCNDCEELTKHKITDRWKDQILGILVEIECQVCANVTFERENNLITPVDIEN